MLLNATTGVPIVAQWIKNLTSIHEDVGLIPSLAPWVKDSACCKLWCRLHVQLGSGVAVAQASSCISWISKMSYRLAMEYYSTLKRNITVKVKH